MDILSHALWTNLILKELPPLERGTAIAFGELPDLISFSFILTRHFIRKITSIKEPPLSDMPKYVFSLYNLTHSLIVWLGVFLFLMIIGLDWWALAFLGWGIHIILDIFTHTDDYFPTPIFWPLSKFHFSGIRWSNKWFMFANYCLLLILYLVFYF